MTLKEVKVRYGQVSEESGRLEKVNAIYLVEAVTYGEAEQRVFNELNGYQNLQNIEILSIKAVSYNEIIKSSEGDVFFEVRVALVVLDESTGREKKIVIKTLAQSDSIDNAKVRIEELMKESPSDYSIKSISETQVVDVLTQESNGND